MSFFIPYRACGLSPQTIKHRYLLRVFAEDGDRELPVTNNILPEDEVAVVRRPGKTEVTIVQVRAKACRAVYAVAGDLEPIAQEDYERDPPSEFRMFSLGQSPQWACPASEER